MKVNRNRKRLLGIGIPVLVLVLLAAAVVIYLETYYHADETAIAAFRTASVEERSTDDGMLVFGPEDADTGLIFYPGGKVEHTAYVPLMRALAERGVLCVLCKMPARLAVLDQHAADAAQAAHPNVSRWYIGGHSLGGAIAAYEIEAHPDSYSGLILLASFSTKDLSTMPIRALSIYGSEDGVLNLSEYDQNRVHLPEDTQELVIEGGCHAYFGMYGAQDGDGEPSISNEEQIRITAEAILAWLHP